MAEESEFTPSSDWCPRPEHWHSEDADATEHEVTELVAAFVRALQPELVVETGTYHGHTAKAIGQALVANGHGELVTIEIDHINAARAAQRCRNLPVHVMRGDSTAWTPPPGNLIGFGWFDSGLHVRHLEIEGLLPHFAPGAIIGVHDTGPQHPVRGCLNELVYGGHLSPIHLRTPRGVTFAEVLR